MTTQSATNKTPKATDAAVLADMGSRTWGIEIETVGATRLAVARAVARALDASGLGGELGCEVYAQTGYNGSDTWLVRMGDGRVWTVMRDGSLPQVAGGEYGGAEIVSPIMKGLGEVEALQAVIREVRGTGAKSSSAHNCGIHVHVGAKDLSAWDVVKLGRIASKVEPMLTEALKIDESRLHYCKAIPQGFIQKATSEMSREKVQALWYREAGGSSVSRYDASRYHGVNLNSYFYRGTVEFRYFNGTLHAGEVKAYVQLGLALAARAKTAKTASAKPMGLGGMSPRARMMNYIWMTLGLRGEQWETLRLHMGKNLSTKKPMAQAA